MAEEVMLYVKSYKELSWKFVFCFGFLNLRHLLICMIFLMLINCILETQNSWGWCHGAGKQLCAGLHEPQSFVQ